ncbi:Chromosome partition protein Smc [Carpediemonas membranifera]|uniref:Chromosome partition protein Smc n=1 Tax=Carpediemonas membranifera TaxID=201153 RepID=A0A8J6BB96_9EUKA|nr:Chromosome partition protein Smc [Carpediemonas membranifera]|eukprot:KAG9397139.1 Chromosome partition protein Smc [Carpediemonas membranifera]
MVTAANQSLGSTEAYGTPGDLVQHPSTFGSPTYTNSQIKSTILYDEDNRRRLMERSELESRTMTATTQVDLLQRANEELQKSFDQAMLDISRLREQNGTTTRRLREQVTDISRQLTVSQNTKADLERQLQKAESAHLRVTTELEHELERMKRARAQQETIIRRRSEELSQAKSHHRELQEAATTRERALDKAIVTHQGKIRSLEEQLSEQTQQVLQLEQQIDQINREHSAQKKKLQQASDRMNRQAEAKERELNAVIERQADQIAAIQADSKTAANTNSQLTTERDNARDQLSSHSSRAAAELARMQETVVHEKGVATELRHKLELQVQQMDSLKAELTSTQREAGIVRETLTSQNAELQESLMQVKEEAANQRSVLETTTSTYENELARIRASLEQRDVVIEQLQDELRSAHESHEAMLDDMTRNHVNTVTELQADLQTKLSAIDDLNDELAQTTVRRDDLSAQLEDVRVSLDKASRDAATKHAALSDEKDRVESELLETQQLVSELRDDCSNLRRTAIAQDKRVHELESALESSDSERNIKTKALLNAQNQLRAMVDKYDAQIAELHDQHAMTVEREQAKGAELEVRVETLRQSVKEAEDRQRDEQLRCERLQTALAETEERANRLEGEVDAAKEQHALDVAHWKKELEAEREGAHQLSEQTTEEMDKLRSRLAASEKTLREAKAKALDLETEKQSEYEMYVEKERDSDAVIAQLRHDLAATRADFKVAVEDAETSRAQLTRDLSAAREARKNAEDALDMERQNGVLSANDRTEAISTLNAAALELKEELAKTKSDAERATKDLEDAKERAERDHAAHKTEISRLLAERQFETEQGSAAKTELEKTRETHRLQLEEAFREASASSEAVTTLESKSRELESRNTVLNKEIDSLRGELDHVRAHHENEMVRMGEDAARAHEDLDRAVEEFEEERVRLTEQLDHLTRTRDGSEATARDLEIEIESLRQQLRDSQSRRTADQETAKEESAGLRKTVRKHEDRIEQLEEELNDRAHRIAQFEELQTEHSQLLDDRSKLLDEVSALHTEVDRVASEAERQIADLSVQLDQANASVKALESDRSAHAEKIRTLGRQVDEQTVVATRSSVELETEKRRLQNQLAERERMVDQLTRQLNVLQQSNSRYSAQLRQTQQLLSLRHESAPTPAHGTDTRLHTAEMELASSRRLVSGLQTRVTTLEGRVGHLRTYVAKLRSFIDRQGLSRLAPPEPPVLKETDSRSSSPMKYSSGYLSRSTLRTSPATPGTR